MRSVTVNVKRVDDYDPDLSYLGEYTSKLVPGVIDRRHGKYVEDIDYDVDEPTIWIDRNSFEGFRPCAGGEPVGSGTYQAFGMQDYECMQRYNRGDWWAVGVYAEAQIVTDSGTIQHIRSGGVYGIAYSGSKEDEAYLKELEDEQIDELWVELRQFGITEEVAA